MCSRCIEKIVSCKIECENIVNSLRSLISSHKDFNN